MSAFFLQNILAIIVTMMVATAYKSERDISFSNADIMSHRKPRPRNFSFDQSFIDKMMEQQPSPIRAIRDKTINQQQAFLPSKDHITYAPEFSIFHHQPSKQNSFTVTSFKDKPLFRDAILKNQKLRREREVLRDNSFIVQAITSEERQAPIYKSQIPFKEQLFSIEKPLKNSHYGQLPSSKQILSQKQPIFVKFPSISDSIKFNQDESYNKLIDLYGRHKDMQTLSNKAGFSMYTKYDDHAFELSSPMSPFSKHLSPLNIDMTPPLPSAYIHGPDLPISSIPSNIYEIYSSEAVKMKLRSALMSESTTSLPGNNCNAPINSFSTTVPSISVSANQSSAGHILTSLTTRTNSPVMDTISIPSIVENGPIQFHATNHGALVTSSLPTQSELKSNVHLFMNMPKNSFNEHYVKFLFPEMLKDDIKTSTQNSMLNYIVSEEHKSGLKGIQNSFADYALPEGFKHGWPLQQFSQAETSFTPLSLNEKTNFVLSNISAIPISINSWPMETMANGDFNTILPLKSIIATNTTNNHLPLSLSLSSDFMTSIPNSPTSSISNSISGSITGGISTGIPSGMMADMPASIPTLNLGQSLHRVEQLRQTQETRNPWYPTGILVIR
ncbi:uncharacterized protein LOC126853583 [Cataglyphis hispanica]|uniref:uncharacterized protein LOC126853583 n=1 Tax=Cataglyphis hispanica TaxID=1086592 RepID=UPI00217F8BC4|nr:uncharacterized protein LOC126853583 [Cataglyphis hispanica]